MAVVTSMDDALEALRCRDELLQIMFWFRGEGLGEAIAPDDLVVFLGADPDLVRRHLDDLVAAGCAERAAGRYTLSERGIQEGGRRFADEFAGLTGQAHGECNNPSCSCQTLGPEFCTSHTPHSAHAR
jgi:hypothetical protein